MFRQKGKAKKLTAIFLSLFILLQAIWTMGVQASAITSTELKDNPPSTFTDVSVDDWFYDSVEYVYSENLMQGTGKNTFAPKNMLTRAMFVTILGRLDGFDTAQYTASRFHDVSTGAWYTPYIAWAAEKQIIGGYGNGKFGTNDPVTREQMAAMIARYVKSAEIALPDDENAVNRFSDTAAVSGYAVDGLELMRVSGIIKGDNKGNFNPKNTATRAEAATIFMRLGRAINEAHTITEEEGQKMVNLLQEIQEMDKRGTTQKEVKDYLEAISWIEKVAETPDGGVTCRTEFGVTGVWNERDPKMKGAKPLLSECAVMQEIPSPEMTEINSSLGTEMISILSKSGKKDVKIAVLSPYSKDFVPDHYQNYSNSIINSIGGSVTLVNDQQVSLDVLKRLDQYDIILYNSHGTLSSVGNSAWAILPSDPFLMTGEIAKSSGDYIMWPADFLFGRSIIDLSDGRIGVGSEFYKHYYSSTQLDDMFFHLGTCYSMYTEKLADGILSRGSGIWVQGWTNSVNNPNDLFQLKGAITSLCNGNTAAESVSLADDSDEVQQYLQADCILKGKGNGEYRLVTKSTESSDFPGGNGTAENPYQVSNAKQLDAVRNDLSAHYIQVSDIDLSSYECWEPIGSGPSLHGIILGNPPDPDPFYGTYDGKGYIISNLKIKSESYDLAGLFGYCGKESKLSNVHLKNISISLDKNKTDYHQQRKDGIIYSVTAGGIAGHSDSDIDNCTVSGNIHIVNCHNAYIGGIVGAGQASNCVNNVNISVISNKSDMSSGHPSGSVTCGGIVGDSRTVNAPIKNNVNYGNINVKAGASATCGEISGNQGFIEYCTNYGSITASGTDIADSITGSSSCVGGIAGDSSSDGIRFCVNYGDINSYGFYTTIFGSPTSYAGGIIGVCSGVTAKISDCYNVCKNIDSKYQKKNGDQIVILEGGAGRIAGQSNLDSTKLDHLYSVNTTFINGLIPNKNLELNQINGKSLTSAEIASKISAIIP